MKSFALLTACLATVKAWEVLLYADDNCGGTGYSIKDQLASCSEPQGLPADFDGKSVQMVNVPVNHGIWIFTDGNQACNHLFGAPSGTYMSYNANGATACRPYVGCWIPPGGSRTNSEL